MKTVQGRVSHRRKLGRRPRAERAPQVADKYNCDPPQPTPELRATPISLPLTIIKSIKSDREGNSRARQGRALTRERDERGVGIGRGAYVHTFTGLNYLRKLGGESSIPFRPGGCGWVCPCRSRGSIPALIVVALLFNGATLLLPFSVFPVFALVFFFPAFYFRNNEVARRRPTFPTFSEGVKKDDE